MDLALLVHHHHPVHPAAQHEGHGVAELVRGLHLDQLEVRQIAHRQLVQRSPVQNGALHRRGREDAQALRRLAVVAHQHVGGALLLKKFDDGQDVGGRIDKDGRTQKGLVHARHAERLQLMLALARRQGAELVAQIRKQQGAKGGVGRNQVAHRLLGQLVGHHLFGRHKAAANLARHQTASVKAIVRAIGGNDLGALHLVHIALDDDEQMGGRNAHIQHRCPFGKIGHIHTAAHQTLLVLGQAVKGGGAEVECTGHRGLASGR